MARVYVFIKMIFYYLFLFFFFAWCKVITVAYDSYRFISIVFVSFFSYYILRKINEVSEVFYQFGRFCDRGPSSPFIEIVFLVNVNLASCPVYQLANVRLAWTSFRIKAETEACLVKYAQKMNKLNSLLFVLMEDEDNDFNAVSQTFPPPSLQSPIYRSV